MGAWQPRPIRVHDEQARLRTTSRECDQAVPDRRRRRFGPLHAEGADGEYEARCRNYEGEDGRPRPEAESGRWSEGPGSPLAEVRPALWGANLRQGVEVIVETRHRQSPGAHGGACARG
jgi:hypothetical protein